MKHNEKNHGHGKHMLFMFIGCLAPILIVVILNLFGFANGVVAKAISPFLFLLCPLMHIFMMKGMMSNKSSKCHDEKNQNKEQIDNKNKVN